MCDTSSKGILPGILVSTDWLERHLREPSLRVVDIRGYVKTTDLGNGRQEAEYVGAPDEYSLGHVPGAVYVDWTSDITDPDNPVPAQLAPPARFADAMGQRGIGSDTDVVVVDHTGGHFATRLWWALRYYGHKRVAVLDGGFEKWSTEKRPLTSEEPHDERRVFSPVPHPELLIDAAGVAHVSANATARIIDARDAGQYRGEVIRGTRGGHIPGAINIPAKSLFDDDGTWKSVEELRQTLSAGGVDGGTRVVAYCNGGVTATAVLFALELTGQSTYANYDGSWNEWGERADLRIDQGGGKE